MESVLSESILLVCRAFLKHEVEHIVIGGAAVALHGYYRRSIEPDGTETEKPDLDIWYNPTYLNYYKLLDALEEIGLNVTEFRQEQSPNPRRSFFRKEFELFTLDLLPEIKANVGFRIAFNRREVVQIKGVDISFLSFDDLIIDKQTNSRTKDVEDIQHLKQRNNRT